MEVELGSLKENAQLRRLLRGVSDAMEGTQNRARLADRLDRLSSAVEAHFDFEERDGYLRPVVAAAPWLEHEVRELKGQHLGFLLDMKSFEGLLEPGVAERDRRELPNAFADFRERLEEHEKREDAVVQRAFVRDVTAAD